MKQLKFLTKSSLLALVALPFVGQAQNFDYIADASTGIGGTIQSLTVIVAGLALLFFFWGLAKFILNAGDENARQSGKQIMIWGVVALFVMVSVWGIVVIMRQITGAKTDTDLTAPCVKNLPGANCD